MPPDFPKADPEDLLRRLAAAVPDPESADRALERAKVAAVRGVDAAPPPRSFPLWRLLLPTSLAAAVIAAFFVLSLTSVAPTPATAAEVLERAAAAEAAYDGWYTIEKRHHATGRWHVLERVQPVAGIRWQRSFGDDASYLEAKGGYSWNFCDAGEHLNVRYEASDGTATLSTQPARGLRPSFPLSAASFMATVEEELPAPLRIETDAEGSRVEVISGAEAPTAAGAARRIIATFDPRTNLLRTVDLNMDPAGVPIPEYRVIYGTEPLAAWRDLLPAGTTLVDHRPDSESSAVLAILDDVEANGIGIPTAVVVTRWGNFYEGTLRDEGGVELFAERGAARLWFKWEAGPLVPGWPAPSLDQVLEHASAVEPDAVAVYDGVTSWFKWLNPDWRVMKQPPPVRGQARLSGELFPTRDDLFGGSYPDVRLQGEVVPEGGVEGGDFRLIATTHLTTGEGTLSVETERFTLHRDLRLPRTRVSRIPMMSMRTERSYDIFELKMFRKPYRVPTRWRTDVTYPETGERAIPLHHQLLPFAETILDASWFTDPRTRWPAAGMPSD